MIDEIVKKITALGVPGLMLLIAINATGLVGAAAITAALSALGPGGMIGGIITLGVAGLISEAIAQFGFDAIYTAVVEDLYAKGETMQSIRYKIIHYPVSKRLKTKLLAEMDKFHRSAEEQ